MSTDFVNAFMTANTDCFSAVVIPWDGISVNMCVGHDLTWNLASWLGSPTVVAIAGVLIGVTLGAMVVHLVIRGFKV